MRRAIVVALGTGVVISSGAAISIGASSVSAESMSTQQYEVALREVEAARLEVPARCDPLPADYERDYCRAEAAAAESVRLAEIEEAYRRTQQASRAAQRARIEARYQLDRARCGAHSGFKRDKCLVQAHAARGRALLEAAGPYARSHEVRF